MASQTDLDQGGTYRLYQKIWLGPSLGYLDYPIDNVLQIITAGTTTAVTGTTLITINVLGLVTVQLWDPTAPAGPGALPGRNVAPPLTIVDVGGACGSFNCTILPAAGKTILGLASVTITNNYGGYVLLPNLSTGNWEQQP